jgi:tetratricopeptide (TPR) repeat protein
LADLLVGDRQFARARRLLSVLMCCHPNRAKHFYRFARALHRDQKSDPARAAKYYKQALDLDPAQPKWWSAYGKLLTEIGRPAEAVAAHKRALELANNEPAMIKRAVEALCLNDQSDEARQLLIDARFRNPRDPRFRKIWNDFQFTQAAESQGPRSHAEPVILPFVRLAGLPRTGNRERIIVKLNEARPAPNTTHRRSVNRRDR